MCEITYNPVNDRWKERAEGDAGRGKGIKKENELRDGASGGP